MEFDLVSVDRSLELCIVNLAALNPGEIVATLLDCESLLTYAAGILDGDGP